MTRRPHLLTLAKYLRLLCTIHAVDMKKEYGALNKY